MSSQLIRSGECRKFSPNIFNKTKCTNCFRQKEEHSAEALESNRATRKVAKCGYLFVAPGWDFSNPINRTKRWQRRWFVLYDDGELSYSLDEHPETVPQASIDMNKVVEVAAADDITGNPYSIAITAPDIVHFVKGTSREEARFWSDVLSVFPRSKGRHKRNATFPGTQPSTKSNIIIHSPHLRGNEIPANESVRNQYNTRISTPVWEGDDVFPTKESGSPSPKSSPIEQIPQNNSSPEPRKVYMGSPPTRDKMDEKVRSRRVVNREKRGLKTGRSFSEDITKMVPTWQDKPSNQGHLDVSHRLLIEEYETECKLKDIADSITRPRSRPMPPSSQQNCIEPTRDGDVTSHKQVRGDPDGCGLDPSTMRYSPSDLRVDLPAEELLNIKRGWLMKQGQDKEWSKHWFVQRGNGLLYYRDPKAEDQGILDGVIDLSGISSVIESQVQRNYGFQLTTWDGRQITLSALTGGIRANWLSALRKAAGLHESPIELSSPTQEQDSIVSSTPRSMLFSSDDEYRTASENGRRESGEWGEALPPSPPLNRTPMSKVKERARGVSKWRGMGSKRSRSSPPNSRRSTLDSVSSQELSSACSFKAKENEDKTPYSSFVEKEVRHEEIVQKLRTPEVAALEKKLEDLMKTQGETEKLRAKDSAELEALKSRYVEEKCKWERAIQIFETELEDANSRCANLCAELTENKDVEKKLRSDLQRLEMRLTCAIEENEALYLRVKELEKPISTARDRARSVDSLSDLTNIDLDLNLEQLDKERIAEEYMDLRTRFEKAVSEIRALKRELRESQAAQDWLELSVVSARQEAKGLHEEAEASSKLMAARIQDLATKLSTAEKQIRTLKQKLTKTDTKEKRRSLSLKGRESFSICKELEEKLAELESRMNVIDPSPSVPIHPAPLAVEEDTKKMDKVSARLRRKSLDSATGSEPLKVLLRLRNLEAKVSQVSSSDNKKVELKLFNGECDEVDSSQKPEVINEVKKMENLLRAKLVVLAKKKETLVSAGQWTNEAKLNLLAEKLAYESVLIGRLHDAVMETRNLDLSDAERLITCLDSKISGGKPSMETSLDYLVKSLAKHLTQQTVKRVNRKPKERKKADSALAELLSKKASIDSKVDQYINEVVEKLAHAFAVESLGDMGADKAKEKIQSIAIQSMAREAVNQELIQEEISQVLNQCTQTYRNYVESENQSRFAGIVKERANLELWGSLADENLNNNIGVAIRKLQDAYSAKLLSLKSEKIGVASSEEDESKSRELLQHFIDVVAHKSLLDARISVLSSGDYTESDTSEPAPFEENSLLSEIQFLYVKFCRELSQESKDEERLKDVVERMSKEVYFLARILNPDSSFHKVDKSETIADNWVDLMCKKCENLKEKLVSMQKFAEDKKECNSCAVLQQELSRIENICKSEVSELEKKHENELSKVQCEFEEQKANLVRHYREEEEKLRDKNWQLEKQIESLNSEYTQQTEDLRNVYSKTLSSFNSEMEEEENLKQRYQAEVQHLRNVCEKGLVGMENSHRRQIAELQAKHEQELAALRQEKDQALAEETHATLAALDAMRKAHEAEVQKEVAKFKAEFVNKMQSNQDLSALHKQHQAEMEEIKREILSLSDKYSIKCVESASLEDKLRAANQQLATAHQHIVQLDARNRQLRAHLLVDSNSDSVPRLHEHTVPVDQRPARSPV
uniref:Protein outspread n=1 Tax=Lygus hesperus TaxID=30085 RepID=A0A146M5E8_LYGHE